MTLFVKDATVNLHSLAAINYGINLGFKIALLVSVITFLWTLSELVRPGCLG